MVRTRKIRQLSSCLDSMFAVLRRILSPPRLAVRRGCFPLLVLAFLDFERIYTAFSALLSEGFSRSRLLPSACHSHPSVPWPEGGSLSASRSLTVSASAIHGLRLPFFFSLAIRPIFLCPFSLCLDAAESSGWIFPGRLGLARSLFAEGWIRFQPSDCPRHLLSVRAQIWTIPRSRH
ncbi:hypothetical protein B0H10DRAFT_899762 [Mycena sp. CBHHK59/15]|nr:hypothetical protein B0H10DRAFT_899762 [Mycena sp. CBHHK59/15]